MSKNKTPIQNENKIKLQQYLFKHKTATKTQLAEAIDVSTVTVNTLVKELVSEKCFIEGEHVQQKMGRPAALFHFNYDQHHSLDILMLEENKKLHIVANITNLAGLTIEHRRFAFSPITIDGLRNIVAEMLSHSNIITSINLSFPGKIVDDIVVSSWGDEFNGWSFKQAFSIITDLPIHIENDANLATIGYCLKQQLPLKDVVVGVYYPEHSRPGICVFSRKTLLLSQNGLAGEGKYLPHIINEPFHQEIDAEIKQLLEIICIYNVVVAPQHFVIYKPALAENTFNKLISQHDMLKKQPNKPKFHLADDFVAHTFIGLQWLATKDTIYA